MTAARVRFEADSLMAAAETQIVRLEYARSLREPSWDGYCGLVPVCEDECRADNVFVRAGWSTTGTSMYTAAPSTPGAASASSSFGEPRARPGHAAAGHRRTLSAESSGLPRAPVLAPPSTGARAQPRPPERPHPHVPDAAAGDVRTQLAHPLLARLAAEEARLRGDAGASGPSGAPAGRPPDLPAARLAALADEAFRAGAATLARGDAAAAVALLDLAARAVPAGHPRAAARIAALLASARAGAAAGAAAPDAHADRAAPGEAPAELPNPAREETSGSGQDRDAEVAAAAAGAADALRDAAGQGGHAAAQAADPRERSAAGPAADGGATQPGGAGTAEGRGRTAAGAEPAQAPAAGQAGADRSVGTSAGEATEGAAPAPGGAPSAEPAAGLTESGGSTTAPTALGSRASGAKSPAVATADTPAEPPAGALARDAGAADAHFGAAVDALQRREYGAAVRRLEAARDACPLDRPAALAKIKRYLAAVGAKLPR